MKANKVTQLQRIARLERLFTQMYLKLEALRVKLENKQEENNGDKTTG